MDTNEFTKAIDAQAQLLEIEERIFEVLDEMRLDAAIHQKQMLGVAEVARLTGYSEDYLRRLVQNRVIPHYKPHSKKIFFDKNEVIQWLKNSRIEAKEQMDADAILDDYINNKN